MAAVQPSQVTGYSANWQRVDATLNIAVSATLRYYPSINLL
jgi:hypothetical protein